MLIRLFIREIEKTYVRPGSEAGLYLPVDAGQNVCPIHP